MEKSCFFDGIQYNIDSFTSLITASITNGVVINNGNLLTVTASGSEMKTRIDTGRAFINGYLYINGSQLEKVHNNPHASYNRIDMVVLRLDIENSCITSEVLTGIPSQLPSEPTLTQNSSIYEIPLAKITVLSGRSYIQSSQVEDRRMYASNAQRVIPRGFIMMWAGSVSNVPSGWLLCDGSNGTPDLRNRFLMADKDNSLATGGSATRSLSSSQMPSHNHSGSTDSVSHSHSGSLSSAGSHSHNIGYNGSGGGIRHDFPGSKSLSETTSSSGSHSHTYTINTGGTHSHSSTYTSYSGSGTSFNTIPMYYTLAYIMKV